MKNIKYFPFERNKYFYGKLLTVDDFEIEQKYMNDKRRMLNRFLHGTGVVCGLQVVLVNDNTISIESGLALDFAGREIVVEMPDVRTLPMIDGFSSYWEAKEENGYLYLCIDYDEVEKEAVHSISLSNASGKEEYNKYREGYRLFLTDQEPEQQMTRASDFYEEEKILYWGYGFRIRQVFPRYVGMDQEFEIKIVVENMGQTRPIRFRYELELFCLEYQGKDIMIIELDETKTGKQMKHELKFYLKTDYVKNVIGKTTLKEGSFSLWLDEVQIEVSAVGEGITYILEGDLIEKVKKKYFNSAMENIIKNNYQQSIYLAKIGILRAGDTYIISQIETMPFQQYVSNQMVMEFAQHFEKLEQERMIRHQLEDRTQKTRQYPLEYNPTSMRMISGSTILDLGIGGNVGKVFYSEEIAHGLGLGKVLIFLGAAYHSKGDSEIIYGSGDIFKEVEADYQADLAAKVNVTTGTFQIGVKLIEPTAKQQIRVYWTAIKEEQENLYKVEEKHLIIKPDLMYLYVRETYTLKVVFYGMDETEVKWTVKEENGGTIDENGKYTAPNVSGIYEVTAESILYPELKTSAFLVVREEHNR